jgi:cobalt-zinc-cadmium efflux system outer membrane protein
MWNMRRELTSVARGTAEFKRQLFNTGQQNESEVLQAEIEAEQAELDEIAVEHTRKRAMRMLAAVTGDASVSQAWLAGDIEGHAPEIAEEVFMESLLRESPAVKIARASLDEAEVSVVRARREAIPDLFVRGGVQQNRELLEGTGRSVGLQGFAEVGVQLKLFNRNQGGVRAAEAEVERARKEVQRVELALREHAAGFLENYETAQVTAWRYRERMLPRAQRAYELLYAGHERMQASWPQVLGAQKMLLELEDEYIKSLERVWVSAVGLENFLLTDGLEAPARAQDMDRAVREVNVPEMSGAAVRER